MNNNVLSKWTFLNFIIKNIIEYYLQLWKIKYNDNLETNINSVISLRSDKNLSNSQIKLIELLEIIHSNLTEYSNINNFINLFKGYEISLSNLEGNKIENIFVLVKLLSSFLWKIDEKSNWFVLLDILNKYGDENYIVGGYNRDILSWKTAKDIDIVSTIDITKMKKILSAELPRITKKYNIKEVWVHFWVLLVTFNNESFEIANPRKDQYNNGTNGKWASDIEIISSIIEDSKRRDFTINQIYYNYKFNYLLDFNNWIGDLINNKINFIWNPEDRIKEDVLRILRVYKFMKKWFNASNKTIKATRSNFDLLCKYWNSERIREALEKLLFSS